MNYSVTRTDLDKDRNDIILLWKRNFPDLPQKRYDWIYQKNPHGKALSWVAREIGSGSTVGTASLFPRKINLNGETVKVGIAGDFAVNQEHRGFNLAIMLQRAVTASAAENEVKLIYGISNEKSEPVQRRAVYVLLGKMKRWAKVLKTSKYFKSFPLPQSISRPLDLVMKSFSREGRHPRARGYTIQELKVFDERFDQLWNRACGRFNIIGVRSEDYLNWRYGKSPHRSYHIFSLIQKDSQDVCGYLVYYLQDKVGFIVDMLFLDFGLTLDSLLSSFILCLRDQNVESVSILLFGCPPLAKKLKIFGFFLREEESRILVHVDRNSPQADMVLDAENWFLLEGDRDI
jgi:predicted N-acetyltransferase YhbS